MRLSALTLLSILLPYLRIAQAFTASSCRISKNSRPASPLRMVDQYEYLKFGGTKPDFDVVEKTKAYVANQRNNPESIYDKDYVLRGGVIGPLTRKDLVETQKGFDLQSAFSDVSLNPFGFTQDPENPYRCFWFERYRAKHTGTLKAGPVQVEATNNVMEGPVHVNAVVWTPEGKIIYEAVGNTVDRHEGNTQGKAAVFGLLHTAGIKLPGTPGSLQLRFQQRLGHLLNQGGRSFSREEDIPKWWTSKSRGADATDASE